MNTETDRAIARAAELTDELARLISFLRSAEPTEQTALIDLMALERLMDGLADSDEVVDLVASFSNGLSARVAAYLAAAREGDDHRARRLLIDLRASSQLVGAAAIAAWCRRREAGEPASESELDDLVTRSRRELTLWRLTPTSSLL